MSQERKIVSIADLKNQATQLVREMQMNQSEILITKHAIPVAILRPVREGELESQNKGSGKNILEAAKSLAHKVTKAIDKKGNALEWMEEQRR